MDNLIREKTYVNILLDTLVKKSRLLDELIALTKNQQEEFKQEVLDDIKFSELLKKKDDILHQLNQLEEGFELLYQKVGQELILHKLEYEKEIRKMQEIIPCITEKSVQLKSLEVDNKQRLGVYLRNERLKVKEFKANRQAASNYYRSMANLQTGESYFMDQKK